MDDYEEQPQGNRARILAVLRNKGVCDVHDISAEIGLDAARIGVILTRLRFDGLVDREKVPGIRAARWAATGMDGDKGDVQIFRVVQSWEPNTCRDALVAALFGAGPAQVAA